MAISNITFGSDPELFIINKKTGKVVSAVGKIPGTKNKPFHSPDMPDGFALQTDNILVEFNIPPCKTKNEFVNNIEYMKNYIQEYIQKLNSNYDILCASSQDVPVSQLRSKQAKCFGCDVDYNAYTELPNEKPDGASSTTRSSGLHLHLGYENYNIDASLLIVKYFDAYIGIPSLFKDPDTKRRSLYGRAGCFRLTDYGLEYRTLGSSLMRNRETLEWLFDRIINSIYAFNFHQNLPPSQDVRNAIDYSDMSLAKYLIDQYHLE